MRARVLVRPKQGILDPQGQAVERALPALGFTGVRDVRIGRLIELEVPDAAKLPEMCERLLANPLVEDYEIATEELRAEPQGSEATQSVSHPPVAESDGPPSPP